MEQVADGVFRLALLPRDLLNVYVVGDVLVDAGLKGSRRKILEALRGRTVARHVVTHAHADHFGSTAALAGELGLPVDTGAADAPALEAGRPAVPDTRFNRLTARFAPPGCPVDRRLREGDDVAGFTVLDTPGHSPGHVSLWRESDRTLVVGDVLFNVGLLTTAPGLREPLAAATVDKGRNRESIRRLAALRPALLLFGHGPPLRDAARLDRFVDGLPAPGP